MAKIEKELKMRFVSFKEQFTIYEIVSVMFFGINKIIASPYLASFTYNFLSKNLYYLASNFNSINEIANIDLFDNTWDLERSRSGENQKLGMATYNVSMFCLKNTPIIHIAVYRSIAWNTTSIQSEFHKIIIDLLKLRGFDAFIEGNDLKFNLEGYKKKFSSNKFTVIGKYFIIDEYINLTVDTDILDIVVKKEIVKEGKYVGIPYNTIVGADEN